MKAGKTLNPKFAENFLDIYVFDKNLVFDVSITYQILCLQRHNGDMNF